MTHITGKKNLRIRKLDLIQLQSGITDEYNKCKSDLETLYDYITAGQGQTGMNIVKNLQTTF